jgi:hypothetical protein
MRIGFFVGRLIALPLRHKLIAAGIVVAFIAGYLVWAHDLPPQEYTSSALLFFDRTVAPKPDPGKVNTNQTQAVELAKSILSDDLVNAICKHFSLFPGSSGGEAGRLRSNLMLSRESTSSLRVSWRGTDRGQTVAVTNTIAVLLTSWVADAAHQRSDPAPPVPTPPAEPITTVAPAEPRPPLERVREKPDPAKARLETILNEENQLQVSLVAADKRLTALRDEANRLEASIGQANAERQASINARQPLTDQLAAEEKKLEQLRVRYTDAYPDVEAAQERITETEQQLAAMPAVRPAPDPEQSRLNTVRKEIIRQGAETIGLSGELSKKARLETILHNEEEKSSAVPATMPREAAAEPQPAQAKPRSDPAPLPPLVASNSPAVVPPEGDQVRVFRILERAANAQPTNNPRRLLPWLVAMVGPLCAVLYLLMAVWWFRTVRSAETLERIVPADVAYLGAIPGMNAWRHST